MRLLVPTTLLLLLGVLACRGGPGRDAPARPAPSSDEIQAALVRGLTDPDRGVRYAAVVALGKAGAGAAVLDAVLEDPAWCVRVEAAWWRARLSEPGRGADRAVDGSVVPLPAPAPTPIEVGVDVLAARLASNVVPEAEAARDALVRLGPQAARSTAKVMAAGHYGALHWGRTLFMKLGEDGAPAVPILEAMLEDGDVNVRETAARCLTAIGPAARAASAALVRCLADGRLCVVSHAALALGAAGVSPALVDALLDPRARVRAYATFALGWALGAQRRIDQVPYEMRLPVLDVDSGDRTGIWSSDPAVAIPAAGLLEFGQLDARASERVVELLLPEGLRPGTPADFNRLRWILGSSEVPAFFGYFVHAGATVERREHVCGNLHRLALPEHLPALAWVSRNFPEDQLEGWGELWFSVGYSARYPREQIVVPGQPDPGHELRSLVRASLEACVADLSSGFDKVTQWTLADAQFRDEDAPWLIAAARRLEDPEASEHWHTSMRTALLRALSRLHDDASLALLRTYGPAYLWLGRARTAALARRGDPEALAQLVASARDDDHALLNLLEVAPQRGQDILVERLTSLSAEDERSIPLADWSEDAIVEGIRLPQEAFAGLAARLARSGARAATLFTAAQVLPGCATRELLERGFELYKQPEDLPDDHPEYSEAEEDLAWLFAAFPERTRAFFERAAGAGNAVIRAFATDLLSRLDRQGRPVEDRGGDPTEIGRELLRRTREGDTRARAELWSMLRAGRYGTVHYQEVPVHWLDDDLAVLPHWIDQLESNCCRVSDGMAVYVFEDGLGMPHLYGSESSGVGRALSDRALEWLRLMGGDFVWSKILDRWLRRPR